MNTVINPKLKGDEEFLQLKNFPIDQKLKILLVLSAVTDAKEHDFFAAFNTVIASDIHEAKQIIHLHNDDFFDSIICDSELSRKDR